MGSHPGLLRIAVQLQGAPSALSSVVAISLGRIIRFRMNSVGTFVGMTSILSQSPAPQLRCQPNLQ